jgi:hypothetical protein
MAAIWEAFMGLDPAASMLVDFADSTLADFPAAAFAPGHR